MDTMEAHGSNSVNMGRLDRSMLTQVWDRVAYIMREHPQGLLEYMEPHDIYPEILHDRMHMWVGVRDSVIELVMITQIVEWPKLKELHVMWLGGSHLHDYFPLFKDSIEQYACMLGVSRIVATCRPGLVRMMKRYGYVQVRAEIAKSMTVLWRN